MDDGLTVGPKTSDLGIRAMSAVVMIALAAVALTFGGWFLALLVAIVAFGVLVEAWGLVRAMTASPSARIAWFSPLAAYVTAAAAGLLLAPPPFRWLAVAAVIGTDVGAYFAGRSIGGPKIAPAISPSKTWAGLFGGMAGAALVLILFSFVLSYALSGLSPGGPQLAWPGNGVLISLVAGASIAILSQSGDFFESWLKRRAGVKDSGRIIPGHGGLFDRVDGLLPIACLLLVAVLAGWV